MSPIRTSTRDGSPGFGPKRPPRVPSEVTIEKIELVPVPKVAQASMAKLGKALDKMLCRRGAKSRK